MEDLVKTEGFFAKRLKNYKEDGYTRIELTFYGPSLLLLQEYQDRMIEVREFLNGCTTYKCSFENQWKERAKLIKSMTAVYFPEKKLFAYCHWWNSVTSKKYGYMWSNVSPKIVPKLLANYSFNDRPIYYFEATVEGDKKVEITKEMIFKRVPGCTAITMVPGAQKGKYPSRDDCPDGAHKFRNVGIIEVDNIKIGWPKKPHDRRSPPLAEIIEWKEKFDGMVIHLKATHPSLYTAASVILMPNTQYTIVAAGYVEYRGKRRWHFITKCGLKVRDGESLRKIWNNWRMCHLGKRWRLGNVKGVPRMIFCAMKQVCIKGTSDMKCKLA